MELIERDEFLRSLDDGFRKAATGEGHCFFIMGEAGIGKTSLVKTFLHSIKDESIQYVGACDSLFTPRPLAPLYDLALQMSDEWFDKINSIASRTELFAKFVQQITNKRTTVVLVFEDIHWADEATLDFVKFFARRINRSKCLFILTFRDDEFNQQDFLRNVLGDLSPDTFTRLELTPLSKEAVQGLADKKGYDGEDVYTITAGNPFYVNEILASYSSGVPENIKDSILSVYNRLEDDAKNVWQMLSVIPEGLELTRLYKIEQRWHEAIGNCIAARILIIKGNKIFFKHELYRRTVEMSLSPFKRVALNKMILGLFLESFEENEEIEKIVHHAKNANENNLVVQFAPLAARQAARVGSHIEASKLFLTAIEYSDERDPDLLVNLYEAYAHECYLISQIKEGITYQCKGLKIWKEKNEIEKMGNGLRFLSRLWWFECNRDQSEGYARQAIDVMDKQPSSKIKAMTYSNMSQLKMRSDEAAECFEWGNKAIEMAKTINDDETLCHALINIGTMQWRINELTEGKKKLLEGLDVALKNSFQEHAARAYSNIIQNYILFRDYDLAKKFLEEGILYCEERNLEYSKNYKLWLRSKMLFETGDWNQALAIEKNLMKDLAQAGPIKIGLLANLAIIEIRKGKMDTLSYLYEARSFAATTKEYQRIMPVAIAFLEYEWLTGKKILSEEELNQYIDLIKKVNNIFLNSEFVFWLQKSRKQTIALPELYEPYQFLNLRKAKLAAEFWKKTGCPYETAIALFEGDENDKREALTILQQLGADGVYEKMKMEMRSSGIKKIPRGVRESTKINPAQLTNRELDVLHLLKNGIQNKEIAGTLFISPKTVDHHISSILFKLDVNSRTKAVSEAVRLGIIK
jgi:DNA-binding CsgD family transcriptional regulator